MTSQGTCQWKHIEGLVWHAGVTYDLETSIQPGIRVW
jgi:hypothetical protein